MQKLVEQTRLSVATTLVTPIIVCYLAYSCKMKNITFMGISREGCLSHPNGSKTSTIVWLRGRGVVLNVYCPNLNAEFWPMEPNLGFWETQEDIKACSYRPICDWGKDNEVIFFKGWKLWLRLKTSGNLNAQS
jgi:hypothetical protein